MRSQRKLAPKRQRLERQIHLAQKLAAMSGPLVAELYTAHAQLCEAKLAQRTGKDGMYRRPGR